MCPWTRTAGCEPAVRCTSDARSSIPRSRIVSIESGTEGVCSESSIGASYRQRPVRTLRADCRSACEDAIAFSAGSPDRGMPSHRGITRSGLERTTRLGDTAARFGCIDAPGRSTKCSCPSCKAAQQGRGGFHPDRAARRPRDHRHPAGDRSPVVSRLQGPRQPARRAVERPCGDPVGRGVLRGHTAPTPA